MEVRKRLACNQGKGSKVNEGNLSPYEIAPGKEVSIEMSQVSHERKVIKESSIDKVVYMGDVYQELSLCSRRYR